MLTSEPLASTLERRARSSVKYPELNGSTPVQITAVDAAFPNRMPSTFTQSAVRIANQTYQAIPSTKAVTKPWEIARPEGPDMEPVGSGLSGRNPDGSFDVRALLERGVENRAAQEQRDILAGEEMSYDPAGVLGTIGQGIEQGIRTNPIATAVQRTLPNADRPRGAYFGSVQEMENAPIYQAPIASVVGMAKGFSEPSAYPGRNAPIARELSDEDIALGLSPRDIAGGVMDVAFDPLDLVTGGTLITDVARLGGKGGGAAGRGIRSAIGAIDDDVAEAAVRAAEGPLEASTRGALRSMPGGSPGAVIPTGPGTPGGRAMLSGGADVAERATSFQPPPTVARLYGVDAIEEGATRGRVERFLESGQVRPDDPTVSPGLLVRAEARRNVGNQATRTAEMARSIINDAGFELDEAGRLPRLAGVDPTVPGAPTLRDIAARLPNYEPYLTDEQLDALNEIRDMLAPYRQALDEVAQAESAITGKPSTLNPGSRVDVMQGGFYIPRGTAETEELADIASRRVTGGGGRAGREGFEKTATFTSEAEGINAGYGYTPVAEAIGSYVRGIGNRTLDRHAANYFISRVDEAGNRLAETVAQRAMRLDPRLKSEVTALKNDLTNLRGAEGRLTARQERVVADFLSDPEMGDIDALRDAVNSISIGTYRGQPGRNFAMTVDDVRGMKQAILDRIEELRPQYRQLTQQSLGTPRDQGRIPLRGLEAYSFPWEMADEAKRILEAEAPRTRSASINALNSLLRGVQATGEMSYLGIQGAIGMASGNRAWRRATKAATRAWLNGGENTLGNHFRQFDARAAKTGRPTLEQYAAAGGRLGGGQTEFKLARGPQAVTDFADTTAGAPLRVPRSVARRADRAFGGFGDVLRAELWDTLAEESIAAGRVLDDVELRKIVEAGNRVTGWTPQRLGGDVGEMLNFAPRYLMARIRALAQLGSRDVRQRQLARRLIGRYIAIGSTLTIAANELNGHDTDFRPFRSEAGTPTWNPLEATGKNPNFMRVRDVAGRDWSLLGPVDATMSVLVGAGSLLANPTANPEEALGRMRTVLSSPLASAGLDWLVFGENFDGDQLNTGEALASDLMRRVVPFAAPELLDVTQETLAEGQEGDIGGAAQEAGAGLVQAGLGGRASPMTKAEEVEAGRYGELKGRDQFEATSAQAYMLTANDPRFAQSMEGFSNMYEWSQNLREIVEARALREGKSPAQARREAQSAIDRHPVYQRYLDVRSALRTQWVRNNLAEAVKLDNEESGKPWDERSWTPTVEQRELMDAYLNATRGQ